jgi:hypothetical protein
MRVPPNSLRIRGLLARVSGAHRGATATTSMGGAVLTLLLLGSAPAGCGNGSEGRACAPGQSIECAGAHACRGHQVCKSDASGYGECLCGDGGLRSFPQVGPFSGLIGAVCTSLDDCRNGLECVPSSSQAIRGEGPSSGMCLQKCTVEHNFCSEVDATSKCIQLDDRGTADPADDVAYCMPGCKLGEQPSKSDKCRSRSDLVCTEYPAGAGAGYCRPSCRSDTDCSPRFCDLSTGLCSDSPRSGDAIGASCDSSASRCAGGCIGQGGSFSECSGVCSYGTEGCGQKGEFPLDYYCALPATPASGPGDLGYCARLCECDASCGRPDAVCEPHPELFSKSARHGFCASKLTPSGGVRENLPCK